MVSTDLAFAVGPRLNAAGRLDDMTLGIQCLLTDDDHLANDIARQMDELNQDRKSIEASMQREALEALKTLDVEEGNMPYGLCLYEANWHQGVIGILASRIKDRYHRPVIVFADTDENDVIKGSARSISGLHIRDVLDAVASQHPGLLTKFGGHAMAAGMSLQKDQYSFFAQAFDQQVRHQLSEEHLQAELCSDGELLANHFTLDVAQLLRDAGPWGQRFPEPLFDGEFLLLQQRILKEKHLKMVLAVESQPQLAIDAIAFNVDISQWEDQTIDRVRVAYKLDVNEFRGRQTLQMMVEYIEPVYSIC